jgi:hypothetical protein
MRSLLGNPLPNAIGFNICPFGSDYCRRHLRKATMALTGSYYKVTLVSGVGLGRWSPTFVEVEHSIFRALKSVAHHVGRL